MGSSSACPRPVTQRGQSQHRRAMARGQLLSAWALLASLAMASWGVRGESTPVGSVAGHSPWSLDVLGGCLVRFSTRERFGMLVGKKEWVQQGCGSCFAQCFLDSLMRCFIPRKQLRALHCCPWLR